MFLFSSCSTRRSNNLTLDIQVHEKLHYFDLAQYGSYVACAPIILITACHQALLYYDYALTLGRECSLFWSSNSFKRWGSILFFLNRYCGVIGHVPIFVEIFIRPDSALCHRLRVYHQFLAIVMQSIVSGMSPCFFPKHHASQGILLTIKQRPSS